MQNMFFKKYLLAGLILISFLYGCTNFNSGYAKDKSHIFYQGEIIPDADRESFEVIYQDHAKDKNGEYEGMKRLKTNKN